MNNRLVKLLIDSNLGGGKNIGIDLYNHTWFNDIHPTITTRSIESNNYFIKEDMKLQLPSELTTRQGKRGKTKTCTVGEVVPFLPPKTCFFDIRHLVVDTDLLPFAVTTRINANNQQYLKELDMNEDITTKVACTLDEGKWARMHEQSRRVFDTDAIAPTQHCCGGGKFGNQDSRALCGRKPWARAAVPDTKAHRIRQGYP